jgi:transcriptional regulator with XRE-family HTH domain
LATGLRRPEFQKQMPHRKFAAALEIDTPMYSKIDRGDRRAKREQITIIAQLLQIDENTLITLWLTDILNKGMRPHLAEYQAKFRKWYDEALSKGESFSAGNSGSI